MTSTPKRVLVTGANGNLGSKVARHLAGCGWCAEVVGLVHGPQTGLEAGPKVTAVPCDIVDHGDHRLAAALEGIDAVVHLAAQNPYPDATWTDSAISIDLTLRMLNAARRAGVPRFVFASSNHVMGGYKEVSGTLAPGSLDAATPPLPGTGTRGADGTYSNSIAYAVAKFAGERACREAALDSDGALSTVAIRIGWCQPGENRPETISATGFIEPVDAERDAEGERDLRWFRNMWLSNRDFVHLVERTILAGAAPWPGPGIIVNGMSRNTGMPWDIETTTRLTGYEPRDDLWRELGAR